jgi:ATP-dependent Clp protease protease subunit
LIANKVITRIANRIKERMNRILSEQTGQPLDVITKDTDRDNFMTAQQAMEYGLVDNVLDHRE